MNNKEMQAQIDTITAFLTVLSTMLVREGVISPNVIRGMMATVSQTQPSPQWVARMLEILDALDSKHPKH